MKLIIRSNQDDNDVFEIEYDKDSMREFATRVQRYNNTDIVADKAFFCVKYYGTEWYIQKHNSFYTEKDEKIKEFLRDKYSV